MGSQSQLNYLPEKQTGFTMIGEEFGLSQPSSCAIPADDRCRDGDQPAGGEPICPVYPKRAWPMLFPCVS